MIPTKELDDRSYVFGALFSTANTLQVLMDRELAPYGITAKQWYLCAVVETFFESPPTLKAVASLMGNSHQNVKQVALKLQEKGLMSLRGDEKDGRATRLHLSERSPEFWDSLGDRREAFVSALFNGLSPAEIGIFRKALTQVIENLETLKGDTP